MKTATVRDLRNHYTGILRWIVSGESVQITQRGRAVPRLVPEVPGEKAEIDWNQSSAIRRGMEAYVETICHDGPKRF